MTTNDKTTPRDRLRASMKYPHDCAEALALEAKILAFAASEVRLALQPRDASPELAEAEKCARHYAVEQNHYTAIAKALADELDRLRASLKRKGEVLRELADARSCCEKVAHDLMIGSAGMLNCKRADERMDKAWAAARAEEEAAAAKPDGAGRGKP